MSKDDILTYVSGLARIELSQEEQVVLGGQFPNILAYIEKLKQVEVDSVEPMRVVHENVNMFRQDEVNSFADRNRILRNAPLQEDNCFKVPSVID